MKWFEDRREHFLCATQERDQYWTLAIAVDADGKILGVRGTMLHDTGAFMPWGLIMPYIAAVTVPGTLRRSELPAGDDGRPHQQGADHAGARRRPAAGGVRHGAADGPRRARTQASTAPRCARRNMIQPEQMPYAVGLIFRDGKPMVYHGGDFPEEPGDGDQGIRLRRLPRAPGRGAQAGPLYRHRHRQLRRRHRPRSVRRRHHPRPAERQGRGRDRRDQPGPGHAHDAVADRRRPSRLPDRGRVMTMADTARDLAGHRRLRQPPGGQRRQRRRRWPAKWCGRRSSRWPRARSALPESEIDVEDGRAIARSGNKPSLTFGELARLAQGMPGVSFRRGPGRRARAHRLFHARRRRRIATARMWSRSRSIR